VEPLGPGEAGVRGDALEHVTGTRVARCGQRPSGDHPRFEHVERRAARD